MSITALEHYGGSQWIDFDTSNSHFMTVKGPRLVVIGSATFGGPYYIYLPSAFGFAGTGGPQFAFINESGQSVFVRFLGQTVGAVLGISAFRAGIIWRTSLGTDAISWRGSQYTKSTGAA